jgi:uncharacterized protein YndB with AHSA1/START domain
MKNWIVSYANGQYLLSRKVLMESARRYGIDEFRPWNRAEVERTPFYKMHKSTLDLQRGSGYWLWKPFIIHEVLKEMNAGDLVVYSDAGIEIIDDISPLLQICQQRELLLFAGHYDDVGSPGPNICSKWTKRDCFVYMGCDEPYYYESRMLDASFLVLMKTERSVAFVREWLLYCSQGSLLTDHPNVCDFPNLPNFIEHRHDQSILSLLAARDNIELFRHPSQYGNHLKDEPYRQSGEWISHPYGSKGIYHNSPYNTLLQHHRGNLGQREITQLSLRRTIAAPRQKVFDTWIDPEGLKKWLSPPGHVIVTSQRDLQVGGKYQLTVKDLQNEKFYELTGEYIEVTPPTKLVYSWPLSTRVTVEFQDQGDSTDVVLIHEFFSNEKVRYKHALGWKASLDKLAATFA